MKASLPRFVVATALFGFALAATAAAQDFQKSYRIGTGGQVRISNISGDVIVTGYDGDAIIVKATKSGRDQEVIEIEDRSGPANVDVGVRYPKNCNCDASVRFEVQAPRSMSYDYDRIGSVSGEVQVTGVSGGLRASSVSGDVHIKEVSGSVSASSVSGGVKVEIVRLEGSDDMKFSSVSGDVSVTAPATLDAEVDISSLSGSINTDFPVEVQKDRHGIHTSARGKLGEGSRHLKMSTVSGSLSLRHQ